MSEDRTAETKDARSFEERVFARFDVVEIRIGKLEERKYDTKPIWEQALAAILEIRHELKSINSRLDGLDRRLDGMDRRLDGMDQRLDGLDQRLDGMDRRFDAIDKQFVSIDARFDKQDNEAEDNFRKLGLKLEVFNENLLELRATNRYFERKLAKLEAHVFPEDPN